MRLLLTSIRARLSLSLLLPSSLMIVGCSASRTDELLRDGLVTRGVVVQLDGEGAGAVAPEGTNVLVYDSPVLTRWMRVAPNRKRLVLTSEEFHPDTLQWYTYQYTFGATFEIEHISSRGADEFYVLGEAPNGQDVVEQWLLNEGLGARTAHRSRAAVPFGQPFHGTTSSSDSIHGGAFSIQRFGTPFLDRHPLYRGTGLGLRAIAVDPDGRFVSVLGGTGSDTKVHVIGISGNPPATPLELFGTAEMSVLPDARSVSIHVHSTLGRVYWVDQYKMGNSTTGFAADFDNDGVPTAFLDLTDVQAEEEIQLLNVGYHDWAPGW